MAMLTMVLMIVLMVLNNLDLDVSWLNDHVGLGLVVRAANFPEVQMFVLRWIDGEVAGVAVGDYGQSELG